MKKTQKKSPAGSKLSGNAAGVASVGNLTHRNTGTQFQPGNPHRFKPGHSGNPGGKPSLQRAVTLEIVKEQLGRVDPKLGLTALERIVAHTIRRALQGSYKDKKLLLNYALGMPSQMLEHSGGIDLRSVMEQARKRSEAHDREEAARALLPEQTPAGGRRDGHSTPPEAQEAALLPDQRPADARQQFDYVRERPRKAPDFWKDLEM